MHIRQPPITYGKALNRLPFANDGLHRRVQLAEAGSLRLVGLSEHDTHGARRAEVGLSIAATTLGGTARRRVHRDFVEGHGTVQKSGNVAGHDVVHAAAQSAHRVTGGTEGLAGVAAVVSIFSANLNTQNLKVTHKIGIKSSTETSGYLGSDGWDAAHAEARDLQTHRDVTEAIEGSERVFSGGHCKFNFSKDTE